MALLSTGCGSSISFWSDNVQQRRTFGPASSQPSLRLGTSNFVKGSGCLLTHPRPSHRLRLTPPRKDMVTAAEQSLHDFSVKDIDQKDVSLSKYKGKVLLIVNVASRCGYSASNYTDLTSLYQKLKGEDFEILAFPCNQFGGQEPGTNQEIKEFACSRFKAEYPIFDKVDVNGSNTAPVYEFLKSSKSSGPPESDVVHHKVSWNFAKFLLDKNGQVVQSYGSSTSPLAIEENIRNLLSA